MGGREKEQELGLLRLELDNFIRGQEISKNSCSEYWGDDDERALKMFYRLKGVLRGYINTYTTLKRCENVEGYCEGERNIIACCLYELERTENENGSK